MNIVTSSPVNTTVKQFGHGPQNAQHKENASERREVGEVMEQRYKTETAHADSKDSLALHAGELQHFPVARQIVRQIVVFNIPFQCRLQQKCRYQHRHQRRDENLTDDTASRDHTRIPQHDCRDVSDRRKSTARVSGNDYQRGIDNAVFPVVDELAQDHDHHDTCRQVVKNG